MQINREEIAAIKRADLRAVVESGGVTLKRKGTNWVGLCPFHDEKTPSFTVNPKTNLWHCFGCGAGGDAIGFLTKKEGLGFRDAVARLKGGNGKGSPAPPPPALIRGRGGKVDAPAPSPANRTRLLNRAVSFYHQTFCEDPRAREYLKGRGITDAAAMEDFQVGYANGTLLNTVPDDGDLRAALKDAGILTDRGRELFYGCAVFPVFDENRDCVGLYGRRLTDGEVNHLYLPGPRRGVWNHQAVKRSPSLILAESLIDALTLYGAGFKDVVPCWGVNGLTEDHVAHLARHKTKEVYVCFDRDDAGEKAAEKITGQLKEKGIAAYAMHLPAGDVAGKVDVNSFFATVPEAAAAFQRLLREANPRTIVHSEKVVKAERRHYEPTDGGFVVQYGERRYEVRGIEKSSLKLRLTVKAVKRAQGETREKFHLDTVDLNSHRSRVLFAKACADLFAEKEDLVAEDVVKLIELAEAWRPPAKEEASAAPKMTRTDEEEALEFLKDPSLFNRILGDFETIGLTGEEANKLTAYLAATSRKLDEPLSILIQSRSAAGKSTLQDAVISLMPTEDYVKYTRLTDQALFYKEEDSLVHKLLAIEEEHGARGASYSIRNIQSSNYLSIAATGKDPATGKLRTEEYRVRGPVSLMLTTTEVELDYETSNRFVTLTIDESREMTARILAKQRERETLEGFRKKIEAGRVAARHQNAQRLLRPLGVVNPYARYLTYPTESLRARRDQKKYLGLIRAIAFLLQYQRPVKVMDDGGEAREYVEVTIEDIELANRLAGEILGRMLDDLSPPSRALLKLIREMVKARCAELKIEPHEYHFTRRDVREWAQWSDFQIKCHIKQLEELEYLYSVVGKKGKEYVYELLYTGDGEEGKPFLSGLMSVERLREKIREDQGK
jgi:DNA primase catalytic core